MNPNKIHRLKHYREFFASIPDEQWCIDHYTVDGIAKCASGHLGTGGNNGVSDESSELNELLRPLVDCAHPRPGTPVDDVIVRINDDDWDEDDEDKIYYGLGKTPKERIIQAVELCLKMEAEPVVTSP